MVKLLYFLLQVFDERSDATIRRPFSLVSLIPWWKHIHLFIIHVHRLISATTIIRYFFMFSNLLVEGLWKQGSYQLTVMGIISLEATPEYMHCIFFTWGYGAWINITVGHLYYTWHDFYDYVQGKKILLI